MKKIIKKDGITRGEISIAPQVNISYFEGVFDVGAAAANSVFVISGSIGGTHVLAIHNIPENHVKAMAVKVEHYMWDTIDAIDKEEGTFSDLINIGYTI